MFPFSLAQHFACLFLAGAGAEQGSDCQQRLADRHRLCNGLHVGVCRLSWDSTKSMSRYLDPPVSFEAKRFSKIRNVLLNFEFLPPQSLDSMPSVGSSFLCPFTPRAIGPEKNLFLPGMSTAAMCSCQNWDTNSSIMPSTL